MLRQYLMEIKSWGVLKTPSILVNG